MTVVPVRVDPRLCVLVKECGPKKLLVEPNCQPRSPTANTTYHLDVVLH